MTTEEKAKAYDEALDRMKHVVIVPKNEGALQALKETIFPELKESEDERIRKSIIHILQVGGYMSSEEKDKAFAYLEKQKINTEGDFGRGYACDLDACRCAEKWLKSLPLRCPKSTDNWKPSEEQMDRLFSIVAALRKDYCDDMADFLASLYKQLKQLI